MYTIIFLFSVIIIIFQFSSFQIYIWKNSKLKLDFWNIHFLDEYSNWNTFISIEGVKIMLISGRSGWSCLIELLVVPNQENREMGNNWEDWSPSLLYSPSFIGWKPLTPLLASTQSMHSSLPGVWCEIFQIFEKRENFDEPWISFF